MATWCVCMEKARPVEPQACAMVRSMSQSSAISAPRAAEFERDGGLDQAGGLQGLVVVGDETIAFVRPRRVGCEAGRKPARDLDDGLGLRAA